MKIANREIKLAIFDMDGTLIDSNNIWKEIDANFFHSRGMEIPPTYSEEIAHLGLEECATFVKKKYNIVESVEEIIKEWQDGAYNAYAYDIPLKEGAKEYLLKLKKDGIKIAIATANNVKLYKPCLIRLGLYDLFDYILDVDIVGKGKDDIKLYDTIAKHFGIDPINIAIFEDISTGLKTGYENGYLTIGVYDQYNNKNDVSKMKQYSYLYIKSFKELL